MVIDEKFHRPAEINELKGDFSKAKKKLGWEPTVPFKDLVQMMIDADMEELKSKYNIQHRIT